MSDDCSHQYTLPNVLLEKDPYEVEEKCVVCGTVIKKGKVI